MTNFQKKSPDPAAARLKTIRLMLHYTRDQMAAALNISPATLKNVENGHQKLSDDRMRMAEMMVDPPASPVRAPALAAMPKNAGVAETPPSAYGDPHAIVAVMADAKLRSAAEALSESIDVTLTAAVIGVATALDEHKRR